MRRALLIIGITLVLGAGSPTTTLADTPRAPAPADVHDMLNPCSQPPSCPAAVDLKYLDLTLQWIASRYRFDEQRVEGPNNTYRCTGMGFSPERIRGDFYYEVTYACDRQNGWLPQSHHSMYWLQSCERTEKTSVDNCEGRYAGAERADYLPGTATPYGSGWQVGNSTTIGEHTASDEAQQSIAPSSAVFAPPREEQQFSVDYTFEFDAQGVEHWHYRNDEETSVYRSNDRLVSNTLRRHEEFEVGGAPQVLSATDRAEFDEDGRISALNFDYSDSTVLRRLKYYRRYEAPTADRRGRLLIRDGARLVVELEFDATQLLFGHWYEVWLSLPLSLEDRSDLVTVLSGFRSFEQIAKAREFPEIPIPDAVQQ